MGRMNRTFPAAFSAVSPFLRQGKANTYCVSLSMITMR